MVYNTDIPDHWDEATDVLIIGSGFAGLAAAVEARKSGAEVLILEKMPYFGGNSRIAGGGYASWDSKLKLRDKLGLGEDSWELHMEDTLRGGGYYGDPALVEVLAREAPDGLNWLIDAGAVFKETLYRLGGYSAYRSYQADCSLVNVVKKQALETGAQLRLNCAVTALCRGGTERHVAGVRVLENGTEKTIAARRGIVVASGGFANDAAMRSLYNPAIGSGYNCTNHKGATGEMLRLACAAGADALHMEFIQLYPCGEPVNGVIDKFAFDCYSGPGFGLIYVNKAGRRFVNELAGRDAVSDAQLRTGSKPTYSILSCAIFEKMAASGDVLRQGVESGRLVRADSIQQLAEALGIQPVPMVETVIRHNESIKTGIDPDFGKPITDQMLPLTEAPFYAVAQWPSVHFTMGGLRIDAGARALDIWGEPIPGLFAAGEVCGGIHGNNRLGGNAIAECIVFGRRAGRNAAGASKGLSQNVF